MNHKKYYKKISRSKIIDVYEKIRELRVIESIPYTELINFLILFTKIEIVPLSNGNDPKIDLDYAKRFLAGKITAKKLHTREKYAWANYEILEGKEIKYSTYNGKLFVSKDSREKSFTRRCI